MTHFVHPNDLLISYEKRQCNNISQTKKDYEKLKKVIIYVYAPLFLHEKSLKNVLIDK